MESHRLSPPRLWPYSGAFKGSTNQSSDWSLPKVFFLFAPYYIYPSRSLSTSYIQYNDSLEPPDDDQRGKHASGHEVRYVCGRYSSNSPLIADVTSEGTSTNRQWLLGDIGLVSLSQKGREFEETLCTQFMNERETQLRSAGLGNEKSTSQIIAAIRES